MTTTRSMSKKELADSEGERNGHFSNTKAADCGQSSEAGLSTEVAGTSSMTGRGGKNPNTPQKPGAQKPGSSDENINKSKGKKETLTLEVLAELIKQNGTTMVDIRDEVGNLKESVTNWQEATELRISALEKANEEVLETVSENKRLVASADASNAALKLEMAEIRKSYKLMEQQLALTQAVVIKNAREANELGREIKKYNIRFGKVGTPIAPPPTGHVPGPKAREDTKQVLVDFICKHDLHPGKTPTQVSNMIEMAYRTGSVEQNRVRHILAKFHRLEDRRIIMINGKKKERNMELEGGAFLQDDHTMDDMSRKKRSHAYMHQLKIDEKRPTFVYGRVKTVDGFIRDKEIIKYNRDNGVEDSRSKEITTDLLTLNIRSIGTAKVKSTGEILEGADIIAPQTEESGKQNEASGGESLPPTNTAR